MQQILIFFWQLCLLRESPEKLPASPFVVRLVLVVYLSIALIAVTLNQPRQTLPAIIGTVIVGLIFQAVFIWSLLVFKRVTHRFTAALASLLGANTLMLLILMPVNFTLINTEGGALNLLASFISWVCLAWWLVIAGSIYRYAINISLIQGAAIAFVSELLAAIVTITLFPLS
jgi:hypothetical protein